MATGAPPGLTAGIVMPTNPTSSKLGALFAEDSSDPTLGNTSFSYRAPQPAKRKPETLPKEETPMGQEAKAAVREAHGQQAAVAKLGLLYAVPLPKLYKLEGANSNPVDLGVAGLALLGTRASSQHNPRQLLLYDSAKRPHLQETIGAAMRVVPQADLYATLWYGTTGVLWQALFKSMEDWEAFARQFALAQYTAQASQAPAEGLSAVVLQDLMIGDGAEVERGDAAQVSYTCWGEVPGKAAVLGEELESVEAKRLQIPARASEGLETGVVGMAKGGKRFIAVVRAGESARFFEVTVHKLKKSKAASTDASAAIVDMPQRPPPAPPVAEEPHQEQSSEDVLRVRMMRLAAAGRPQTGFHYPQPPPETTLKPSELQSDPHQEPVAAPQPPALPDPVPLLPASVVAPPKETAQVPAPQPTSLPPQIWMPPLSPLYSSQPPSTFSMPSFTQPSPIPGAVQGAGGMWYMPIGMGGSSNTEEMVREVLAGVRTMIHPQQEQGRLLNELFAEIRGGGEGVAAMRVHMAQQQQSIADMLTQVLAEVQQLRAHQASVIQEREAAAANVLIRGKAETRAALKHVMDNVYSAVAEALDDKTSYLGEEVLKLVRTTLREKTLAESESIRAHTEAIFHQTSIPPAAAMQAQPPAPPEPSSPVIVTIPPPPKMAPPESSSDEDMD